MTDEERIEIFAGSGNVFRDLNFADADVLEAKTSLAARIIAILEDRSLSVRQAEEITGFNYADFSRVRNADLDRFSLEFLIRMVTALDENIEVRIDLSERKGRKSEVAQPALQDI